MHQILASVFISDFNALKKIYEDETINKYYRMAAIKAIFIILHEHLVPQEESLAYIRKKIEEAIKIEDVEVSLHLLKVVFIAL